MSQVLTVATRRGELAIAQTRTVIAALKAGHPEIEIRIREITSAGDRDRKTALWDLKDTGFFTSQLEEALLAGEADLAVHSFKDLPTARATGLAVPAICDRKWPEDCLLAKRPIGSLDDLPKSARVGTSSLRRAAQLRHLRPDLELVPLRGNVQTRINKLQTTDLDAIILARAGLERLGLTDAISLVFDPKEFIPAPAQGAWPSRREATTSRPWRSSGPSTTAVAGGGPGRTAGAHDDAMRLSCPGGSLCRVPRRYNRSICVHIGR